MSIEKTQSILRILKLAGREDDIVTESFPVIDAVEDISEADWSNLPKKMRAVIEDEKYVLSYADNKFSLKKIKTDNIEDKKPPSLNSVSDFEKDGGDMKKTNKKMIDNDKMNEEYHTSEKPSPGEHDADRKDAADMILKHKRVDHWKVEDPKSADDIDQEVRHEERLRKEAKRKKADEILSKSSLAKATVSEQFQNKEGFDDKDAEEFYGLDKARELKVKIPRSVTKAINSTIKEIEASIGQYDDKGYNDGDGANSNNIKAIDALEQIKSNLSSKDYEGFKQAQQFFLTLMSPITNLFPAELINFLAVGTAQDEKSGFSKEVEPFETKLSESYMFNREAGFNKYFIDEILPNVIKQYGPNDKPAIGQAYTDTLDGYHRDGMLPDSSNSWTLPDEVVNNPTKYLGESDRRLVEYGTDQFDDSNTALETWFERDRKYVGLYPVNDEGGPDTNASPIIEWKDEDVDEAIESGYLDPRDLHASALSAAKEFGLIKENKSSYSFKNVLEAKRKSGKNKTATPCWPGYKQIGMKKGIKGEKDVPNCVPDDDTDK